MPLPASQPVVTQLTIDASGAASGAAQYDAAMARAEAAANKLVAANDNLQKLFDQQSDTMKQIAAANDNVSRSWGGIIDGAENVGSSLEKTTENILNTINHLKLLALGIYAISPAFRSVVNAAIPTAIGLIGEAASAAAKSVLSFFGPMLAFFARITGPIAAAVVAWKALNYVWQQGADLLEKYANYNRTMFTPSNGAQAFADATKFQQNDLSASQIAYASELGTRLDDANRKIQDFFKVSFDVTNLALGLQSIWVNIVEVIATVVTKLQNFLNMVPGWIPKAVDIVARAIPGIGGLYAIAKAASDIGGAGAAAATPDDAMSAARKQLAAAMAAKYTKGPQGNSFDARFWNFATQSQDTPDKAATNAYDRAIQNAKDQIDLLKLEADGVGKTTQQYQEMKTAHELTLAAMKAGKPITDDMRAEWKALADEIADYTIKARAAAALQNEQFKGATMFMSPADQAAANVAHQIDPADWQAHMHDLASETARFNSEMGQARDISLNFLQSFNQDIMNGTVNMNSLANAVRGLGTKLLDIAENSAINALFGGLTGGSGGLLGGLFGNLFGAPSPVAVGHFGHNAMGTDNWSGGPTWVGEQGPEVVNLPRGSQVIPNNRISVGGMSVIVNNNAAGVRVVPRQTNGGLTIDVVEAVVDQKIGAFNKALPDRVSQINRDPRLRGR